MSIQWMRTAVELTSGVAGNPSEPQVLQSLCDHCVELLGTVTACAVLLADGDGRRLRIATDTKSEEWLADPLRRSTPPDRWLEFLRSAEDVCTVDLRAAGAVWPDLAPGAAVHGAVLAVLLTLRQESRPVGVLQLLCTATGPTATELELTQSLADVVMVHLARARLLRESTETAEQLRHALYSRVVIEQAKGMLAERWDIDTDLAFQCLRGYARERRMPLHDLARDLVERRLPGIEPTPPG
ncbi:MULTISPECIES: GAF and ANTAR domain-containing protein [Streptacidiphilus]|uniref:GAF and ANTAR domain-containing protein n=1 Tax=Streptacidiphilus cavernicola TaxID=3342716 RepID=A0ABV6UKV2_9ACTN|nr:ANTAR domain-containing protein [Streptacidiphilus jeojiense]